MVDKPLIVILCCLSPSFLYFFISCWVSAACCCWGSVSVVVATRAALDNEPPPKVGGGRHPPVAVGHEVFPFHRPLSSSSLSLPSSPSIAIVAASLLPPCRRLVAAAVSPSALTPTPLHCHCCRLVAAATTPLLSTNPSTLRFQHCPGLLLNKIAK
jgi:hypothetical protein